MKTGFDLLCWIGSADYGCYQEKKGKNLMGMNGDICVQIFLEAGSLED